MKEKIDQIRFYSNNNEKNTNSFEELTANNNNFYSLVQYGTISSFNIQTLPGTEIIFQYRLPSHEELHTISIIIDHSGRYNFECNDYILTGFAINEQSLNIICKNKRAFFIAIISHI